MPIVYDSTGTRLKTRTRRAKRVVSRRKRVTAVVPASSFPASNTSLAVRPFRAPSVSTIGGTLARPYRAVGSELYYSGTLTGTNTFVLGNYVSAVDIGPRIARIASLYDKYSINSLTFELVASGSMATAATAIMFFDIDCTDSQPPASTTGAACMLSSGHALLCNVVGSASFKMPVKIVAPSSGYYSSYDNPGADPRLTYAGLFYLFLVGSNGSVPFQIMVHYDVTLWEPSLVLATYTDFEWQNLGSGARPVANTSGPGWDLIGDTLARLASTVEGVTTWTSSAGDLGLKLKPGTYYLQQTYRAKAADTCNAVGFDNPVGILLAGQTAPVMTNLSLSLVNYVMEKAVTLTKIVVAAGTIVALVGRFLANSYVNEVGNPDASLFLSMGS